MSRGSNVTKGKRGFQGREVVDVNAQFQQFLATEKSAAVASAPKKEIFQSRNCACTDPDRCRSFQKRYYDLGKTSHVGYTKVSGVLPLKKGENVTRIEAYRQALKIPIPPDAAPETRNLFVAFSHFPTTYLEEVWDRQQSLRRIGFTMPAQEGEQHGFSTVVPHSTGDVLIVPMVTLEEAERDLEKLEAAVREAEGKEKKAQETKKRREATDDDNLIAIMDKLSNEPGLTKWLQKKQREAKECQAELAAVKEKQVNAVQDLEFALTAAENGLSRKNMTSEQWHADNPEAAKYYFGVAETWKETKYIVFALWPHMEQISGRDLGEHLTQFEQCLITRMRMHKAFELQALGNIFGRTKARMGQVVKAWAPRWGAAGLDFSILDLQEYFLELSVCTKYVEQGMGKVCALVDGTDLMTDANRHFSLTTRTTRRISAAI
jgi:hypothetical protein